jgi:hypothetical protein
MNIHIGDNDTWPENNINLTWEMWLRHSLKPIIMKQRLYSKSQHDFDFRVQELLEDIRSGRRTLDSALVLICGETGIVTTKKTGGFYDPYEIGNLLDKLAIKIILNPIHSRMSRPHFTNAWRSYLSRHNRFVLSVWNAESKNESEQPWTLFRNETNLTESILKLHAPFPERRDIAIGIVDIPH